ncbi:MAG: NPCBM/NEW2 domain-containing protein [Treponema sp.]|jgi:hypothetical protein|nr:NPCBM/NEW2 domain-containing protein [Treponema sp.]
MIIWVVPLTNQCITDIATHFVWQAMPNATSYHLEYGSDIDFIDCISVNVEQIPGCKVGFFFAPECLLPKDGTVFARVKSNTGESSEILCFTCNTAHQKSPLRWDLSPEKPYFTIFDYGDHDYGRVYDLLPDSLKPYSAIGNCASYRSPSAELLNFLMDIDGKGYPWHLGAAGPHLVNGELYTITPLSTIEYLLQHARNMKSVGLVEQYMGIKKEGDWKIEYFKRVIMLCAKYGVPVFYADGNRNYLDLASFIKRPIYMNFFREYHSYITLAYKQNHGNAAYTSFGAILGAWIDGGCAHIGVQPENWYWNDAGFRDDPGNYYGYLQGNEQQISPCMTAQMILTGLSIGACYYSMEGEGWLIQARGNDDLEWSDQGLAALSLMQSIIHYKLIPKKLQVLEKISAVVDAEGECENLGDAWVGGKYRRVFQNIYGIDHGFEIFLKQSRYFYLPLATDRKDSFGKYTFINADSITDPAEVNTLLDPLYPETFTGDIYLTDTGRTYVLMNSNENRQASQYFIVEPHSNQEEVLIVKRIEGALGLWQYMVFWQKEGIFHLLINAPAGTGVTMRLYMDEKPAGILTKESISIRWEARTSCLELSLIGSGRQAELICASWVFPPELHFPDPVQNKPDHAIYLSDFPFSRVCTNGPWMPIKNYCANGTYGKLPASMNSLRYPHSFSFMRNSELDFDISGHYHYLEFTCGFDIDAWMPIIIDRDHIIWDRHAKTINLCFTLLGDGKELYVSPPLHRTDWRRKISVNVETVKILSFRLSGDVVSNSPGADVYMDIGNPILS